MPTYTLSADFLAESKKRTGEREIPDGSNGGPYVSRIMRKTTYGKDGPWCAGHVNDVIETVVERNGGPDFPCDSAAVETWDKLLDSMGYRWTGAARDLPPGAIICQGGRHITFFNGWARTPPPIRTLEQIVGWEYHGHGGNQANQVKDSVYRWTSDTRAYVIPDAWDKRAVIPPKPRPLREVITGEGENRQVVFHGRHVPTLLNRVRKAIQGGARKVVVRTVKETG